MKKFNRKSYMNEESGTYIIELYTNSILIRTLEFDSNTPNSYIDLRIDEAISEYYRMLDKEELE